MSVALRATFHTRSSSNSPLKQRLLVGLHPSEITDCVVVSAVTLPEPLTVILGRPLTYVINDVMSQTIAMCTHWVVEELIPRSAPLSSLIVLPVNGFSVA